jgi:hypothetical protein
MVMPKDLRAGWDDLDREQGVAHLEKVQEHVQTEGDRILKRIQELNLPEGDPLHNEVASVLGLAVQGLGSAVDSLVYPPRRRRRAGF